MSGWSPPRPERARVEWQEPARTSPAEAAREVPLDGPPRAPEPRGRPTRRPALPSPRRIVAFGTALLVAIALVAGVGTLLTPRYGDLEPYGTTPVADLRTKPTMAGWTVDLARTILPGVPPRCVTFASPQPTGRYVVVDGATPSLGSSTRCSQASLAQVQSTVGLLDTDSGRVLLTRNLADSFPSRSGAVSVDDTEVVTEASRVVVQLGVDDRTVVASLSLTTGDVLSSDTLDPGATGDPPEVSGRIILFGGSVAREGSTLWTLSDVAHVDQPIWSGLVDDSEAPTVIDHAAFATIDGRSSRIDASTGRVTRLGDGSVNLAGAVSNGDLLFTDENLTSGVVVTAWDAAGRAVWTRSGIGTPSGLTRDCLMAALPGTSRGLCVDPSTGRTRWSADLVTGAFASSAPGQTTNDVTVYVSKGNDIELDFYDGDTGKKLYPIVLPPVSYTLLVSRTTGYLEVTSDSGTPTGITAFDTASGRQLWTLPEAQRRDTEFWGGQLVRVTKDGVATQLVTSTRPVLGRGGVNR